MIGVVVEGVLDMKYGLTHLWPMIVTFQKKYTPLVAINGHLL